MKYFYTMLLAIILVLLSLIITFLTGFPFFLLFLPFPTALFRRKRTPEYGIEQENDGYTNCGYCGRHREENWIVCPFCGKDYEKSA